MRFADPHKGDILAPYIDYMGSYRQLVARSLPLDSCSAVRRSRRLAMQIRPVEDYVENRVSPAN